MGPMYNLCLFIRNAYVATVGGGGGGDIGVFDTFSVPYARKLKRPILCQKT